MMISPRDDLLSVIECDASGYRWCKGLATVSGRHWRAPRGVSVEIYWWPRMIPRFRRCIRMKLVESAGGTCGRGLAPGPGKELPMIIWFMHGWAARIVKIALGSYMVIESVYTNFVTAVPLILMGSVIAVSGIADISILEVAYQIIVGTPDETTKPHEHHA
jgi:hypothetical protein